MVRIPCIHVPILVLFAVCTLAEISRSEEQLVAEALAHFRFNGNAIDVKKGHRVFELRNTEFKENALYLNGLYEFSVEEGGYSAICSTPGLDYDKFAVALRFKAVEFNVWNRNLLTGGTAFRWFGLERSQRGNLVVMLDNSNFKKEIEGVPLEAGKWTVVACSVDVLAQKVTAAVNGTTVAIIDLPKDFALTVTKWNKNKRDADKVWSFTNYANGGTFHGLVDEIIIYDRALSVRELEQIPLRP